MNELYISFNFRMEAALEYADMFPGRKDAIQIWIIERFFFPFFSVTDSSGQSWDLKVANWNTFCFVYWDDWHHNNKSSFSIIVIAEETYFCEEISSFGWQSYSSHVWYTVVPAETTGVCFRKFCNTISIAKGWIAALRKCQVTDCECCRWRGRINRCEVFL